MGGVFFDALFNLNKFIGFEQRDPFAERQRRNDPFETDWDRCVWIREYGPREAKLDDTVFVWFSRCSIGRGLVAFVEPSKPAEVKRQ